MSSVIILRSKAVREALLIGELSKYRYTSYIFRDSDTLEGKVRTTNIIIFVIIGYPLLHHQSNEEHSLFARYY